MTDDQVARVATVLTSGKFSLPYPDGSGDEIAVEFERNISVRITAGDYIELPPRHLGWLIAVLIRVRAHLQEHDHGR